MATKRKTSKTMKKAPVKKSAAKKPAVKKAVGGKKVPPAKGAQFHLYDEGQKKFIPAQQAKAVKVDGFDAFSFFLHKSADGRGWTISEASSGGRIAVGRTQKEAKEKAKDALGKHGADDLAESIQRTIAKNGVAPGFGAPKTAGEKQTFAVTTDDGIKVEVAFDKEFRNHLEFRGEISPTGYRSHFGYEGKGKVEDAARIIANDLRAEYLKEQAKASRKGKKGAEAKTTPQVTTRLKSSILAALVDDKKLPRLQVHFDDIAKATGADVGDVAATLMVLELNRAVKSLPGKLYRLTKAEEQKPSGNRGHKPNGTQCLGLQNRAGTREDGDAVHTAPRRVNARRGSRPSQLDAAVEILKEAKEPLTCKEICRRMFERKIWETSGRTPGATLSASMQREIAKKGKDSRFRRFHRGQYELNA